MKDDRFLSEDNLDSFLDDSKSEDELTCMDNDMRNLLKCFSNKHNNNSEISKHFKNYFKKYDRFLYSTITPYLTSINHASDRDVFLQKISEYYHSQEADKLPKEIKVKVLKLYDHVNLVICQNSTFYTSRKRIQNISKECLEEANKEIKDQVQNVNTQLISIVSIFVAIPFVMFGGMSLLNNLFDYSRLERIPLIEMLCGGSLIGLIIVAVMYGFILTVIKLTNHDIGEGKELLFRSVINRTTWFLFFIFVVTLLMWLFNFHSSNDISNSAKSYQTQCKTVEYSKKTKEVTLVCPADVTDAKEQN